MADHKFTLKDRLEHADRMISYYQTCLSSGHSFRLGLYMATQWRHYLTEKRQDLSVLRLFANALEGGADMHGTGWADLTSGVKSWLVELEEGSKTP